MVKTKTNIANTVSMINTTSPDLKMPSIKIKSIQFKNFKVFDDYTFNFCNQDGEIKDFICFIGPMGSGKSTVLYTIQMLFSKFDGYESTRIVNQLSKYIRHTDANINHQENFKIIATILINNKPHKIIIDKNGFSKKHPKKIRDLLYRICYLSKLDQDLNKFQLKRDRWDKFKDLFEAVSGYEIEECVNPFFNESDDPHLSTLLRDYVLDFVIKKPFEIIHHKECSDGEKKIIKSFSTMLNLEYTPPVILIDNFEMHVHRLRHMILMESLRKCYPESQIFSTTHSHHISRMMGDHTGIFDMRVITGNEFVKKETWRLRVIDEIDDCIMKLKTVENDEGLIEEAKKIKDLCYREINDLQKFMKRLTRFFNKVSEFFVEAIFKR